MTYQDKAFMETKNKKESSGSSGKKKSAIFSNTPTSPPPSSTTSSISSGKKTTRTNSGLPDTSIPAPEPLSNILGPNIPTLDVTTTGSTKPPSEKRRRTSTKPATNEAPLISLLDDSPVVSSGTSTASSAKDFMSDLASLNIGATPARTQYQSTGFDPFGAPQPQNTQGGFANFGAAAPTSTPSYGMYSNGGGFGMSAPTTSTSMMTPMNVPATNPSNGFGTSHTTGSMLAPTSTTGLPTMAPITAAPAPTPTDQAIAQLQQRLQNMEASLLTAQQQMAACQQQITIGIANYNNLTQTQREQLTALQTRFQSMQSQYAYMLQFRESSQTELIHMLQQQKQAQQQAQLGGFSSMGGVGGFGSTQPSSTSSFGSMPSIHGDSFGSFQSSTTPMGSSITSSNPNLFPSQTAGNTANTSFANFSSQPPSTGYTNGSTFNLDIFKTKFSDFLKTSHTKGDLVKLN